MKYVLLFAAFVAIAQIDTLMKLFDKASEKVSEQKTKFNEPASTAPIGSGSDVLSRADDPTLRLSPHAKIIALLDGFKLTPDQAIRVKVMEDIRIVPKLLTAPLDPAFESSLFGWRDLLVNQNLLAVDFLMDLENLCQGENQLMIRKLMTVVMDHHLDIFLKSYQRSKDSNCKVAILLADPLPDEEKVSQFQERDDALTVFLQKDNLDAATKNLATMCQLVLRSQLASQGVAPVATPSTVPENVAPAQIQPAPVQNTPTTPATNSVPRIIVPVP